MGSLRDLRTEARDKKEVIQVISKSEYDELIKWLWNLISPKTMYCDISLGDEKKYEQIKELLSQHVREK